MALTLPLPLRRTEPALTRLEKQEQRRAERELRRALHAFISGTAISAS